MSQSTAYPAPSETVTHHGRTLTPAQLAIVAAAIDAGVFYTEQMRVRCAPEWRALLPCSPRAITGTPEAPWVPFAGVGDGWRTQREALSAQLRELPRGAHAIILREREDGFRTWYALIHDGAGYVHEPSLPSSKGLPQPGDLVDDMIGMEIYLATQAECERRSVIDAQTSIRERGLSVGRTLRDVRLGARAYSSAVITHICPRGAYVTLLLTKRGSRKRWEWTGLAQNIALPGAPAAEGLPLVVDARGRTLFSAAA